MSDYNEFSQHINETLKNMVSSIGESQKLLYDSIAPSRALQSLITEMVRPYHELYGATAQSISFSLTELSNNIAKEMADTIAASFSNSLKYKELIESLQRIYTAPNLVNVPKEHTYIFSEDLGELSEDDDFVTADESVAKEYKVPDSIAIPIGHNKIKMKTSDFIALIALISQFIFAIISSFPSTPTETEVKQIQAEEAQILLLESQNQMLRNLFHNIDLSSSSQAKFLQSLKESVEVQNSAISDLEESLDLIQQSLDNMSEPGNTESES